MVRLLLLWCFPLSGIAGIVLWFVFSFSGVSRYQGSPGLFCISLCHLVLSMTSSTVSPTLSISPTHEYFLLVCCLPPCRPWYRCICHIRLSPSPSAFLLTWPYHVSILSVIFFATLTDPHTCPFRILSFFRGSTRPHQYRHIINSVSFLFFAP